MKLVFVPLLVAVASVNIAVAQDYNKGKYLLETGQFNNAKKHFSEILKNNPTDAKAMFYLGDAYLEQNKVDSARIFFSKGMESDSKSGLNSAGLARLIFENNAAEGKAAFDKTIGQLKSKDVETPVYIAEYYISRKEADKALEVLGKQLEGDVKNQEVALTAGDAYLLKNDGSKALEFYERKAIALNPENPATYVRIGKLYAKTRNYDMAMQYFNKAIEKDGSYSPAHREIAEVYYKAGQYKKAIAAYEKFMTIADKDPESDYRYASFIFLNKDYVGALKYLTDLTSSAVHKDNIFLYRLLAYSYFETNNIDKAQEHINTFFAKAKPEQVIATDFEYLGKIQGKKGNSAEAITNLKKALEKDPANTALFTEIGNIYYTSKSFKEAVAAYEGKLQKTPGNANEYLNYGKSLYFLEDFKKADSAFAILAGKIPDLPQGHLWRAKALEQQDKDMKDGLARPHYEKFSETAEKERDKYKNDLINAYSYLGSYYSQVKDNSRSANYWQKVKELDPANKNAAEALKNYK